MPKIKLGAGVLLTLILFILTVFLKVERNIFDAVLIGFSFILMIVYSFLFGGLVLVTGFLIKLISYGDENTIIAELAKYLVFMTIFYYAITIFEKYKKRVRENYLIAERISLGVAVVDEKMNYIYVNSAYAQLKGNFRSEIEGKNFKKYWHKENEQKELYDWIEDNMKNKTEWSGDILSRGKEGKEYWEEVYIFPVEIEKNKYQYVILAKDISYRVEMEKKVIELKRKAVEASYEKSRFLANMSHDIRTPINGIIGFADILVEMEEDEEKLEMLHVIKNSSELLVMLINDILDLSKIEAGKIKINYEEIEFEKFIKKVAMKFEKMIEIKGLQFIFDYDKSIYKTLIIDRVRLEQVLMNLLGNAMKFTENGEIVMKVIKKIDNEKSQKIRFEVKDSGMGIPKEKLDAIFEEFTQANETITEKYGGTGLGLAISKKLVDKMGGKLNVESIENKGTKFYFELELKKGSIYEIDIFDKNGKRRDLNALLFVEDKEEEQFLKNDLKEVNIKINTVTEINKLINEINNGEIDILILDMDKDSDEKIKVINSIKNNKEGRQFFIYKDYISENDLKDLKKYGFDNYLSKKWKKEDIVRVINSSFAVNITDRYIED
jgi:PAS domain S-box-containing protein